MPHAVEVKVASEENAQLDGEAAPAAPKPTKAPAKRATVKKTAPAAVSAAPAKKTAAESKASSVVQLFPVDPGFEEVVTMAEDNLKSLNQTFLKGFEDLIALQKQNLDALMTAQQTLAEGNNEISKEIMSLTQGSIDDSMAYVKAYADCKTLQDVLDVQTGAAKSSMEKLVSEGQKLTEKSTKLANDVFGPLQGQMTDAMNTVMKTTQAA